MIANEFTCFKCLGMQWETRNEVKLLSLVDVAPAAAILYQIKHMQLQHKHFSNNIYSFFFFMIRFVHFQAPNRNLRNTM